MSDPSFVCATCGQRHSGLPTDYGFRLPDQVHALSYIERYRRSRSNADLCTLDIGRLANDIPGYRGTSGLVCRRT
ncbi:DUF2199 domain-containing protein [Aquabacterium sp. A7-Y]|uniref:DUF2199 domain-containing protein n=1 Tax=Aquabacterium sp. A7-Y TaxID=1349605 RepID=UPI0039FD880A